MYRGSISLQFSSYICLFIYIISFCSLFVELIMLRILNQKGMYNRCHLARLVVEESVQQEKTDDPGEGIEGKGDQKPEDDKKSEGPPNDNESKPRASETSSNNSINKKKTNRQNNNSANISKYFTQTNKVVKK